MKESHYIAELSDAWIRLHALSPKTPERTELTAILDQIDDLIRRDPVGTWEFIETVTGSGCDPHLLSNLAAGPLEDYLVAHGERELSRLERLAKQDPALRQLLGMTWRNAMSEDVWLRVQKAAVDDG